MSQQRVILSDETLNRYGYWILTSGLQLDAFLKNPVMLYMHFRDEGTPEWCDYKAIGYWDDIKIEGNVLSAIPVFDKVDDLSKTIAAKYEAGTLRAASLGIRILATSSEKEFLLPGQTRETVLKAEVMEASIVDIPANANAVRLYDRSTSVKLAAGMDSQAVPELKQFNPETMKFNPSWSAFLTFLGIAQDKAEVTELSADNLNAIHAELERLKTENNTLVQAKQDAETERNTATTEVTTLKTNGQAKDTEISNLKKENGQLKEQVQNLKNGPAPGAASPTPKTEPAAEADKEELAAFCDKNAGNYQGMTERLKAEGLL